MYVGTSILDDIKTDETKVYGLNRNELFLNTVFALKANEVSEPIVTNGYIVVVQPTAVAVKAKEPAPIEAIRQEVAGYDITASNEAILHGSKTVDNVRQVYTKYLAK